MCIFDINAPCIIHYHLFFPIRNIRTPAERNADVKYIRFAQFVVNVNQNAKAC